MPSCIRFPNQLLRRASGARHRSGRFAAPNLEKKPLLRWLRGYLRITPTLHGESFFVRQNGILWAPPMFLVLILIAASDVVLAVDSIPAIFLPP